MNDTTLTQLVGDRNEVAVDRAIAELRSGRPVLIQADQDTRLVIGAEAIEQAVLNTLGSAGRPVKMVMSQQRLRALGHDTETAGTIPVEKMGADEIHDLISQTGAKLTGPTPARADMLEEDALQLMRLAMLLPAAICLSVDCAEASEFGHFVRISADSLPQYRDQIINTPRIVARAPVPLDDIGESEFVVFRGGEGMRDQVAVVIGNPDPAKPVYARMHSACLTGDLFGSLKCDCGDQLRGSAKFMAENGGGVLLYLDQEGRGNGIANKMRAYRLQHAGYSTFDADEILGFDLDQRGFNFAADILRQLGYTSIKLLTNNPVKVAALTEAGLNVVSNHRAKARFTLHNVAYLAAKRDRAGHMIEDDLEWRE